MRPGFKILPALILALSCKEAYLPDDLESTENKVPVIQGMISENTNPEVKLSWAIPYEQSGSYPILGAEVTLTENDTTILLEETSEGIYKNEEYTGLPGRTYILHVVLPDESEYISTPQKIQPPPEIDTLFAKPGMHLSFKYNYYGEPLEVLDEGLFLISNLSSVSEQKTYFRFRTKVLREYYEFTMFSKLYGWEISFPDGAHSVDYTLRKDEKEVLSGYEPGFMKNVLLTGEGVSHHTECWIVTFKVFSISQDVYNYYQSLEEMLSSDTQIFSPFPSQGQSNITCVNDPEKLVAGVFEGSSFTIKYKAFGWQNLEFYGSMELDTFPDINSAGISDLPPDFWIDVNTIWNNSFSD